MRQRGADAVLEIALQQQRAPGVALRAVEVAEMPASHPADPQRVRVRPPLAALAAQLQCTRAGAQRILVPAGVGLRHRELEQRGQLGRPIVAGNVTVDRPFEQRDRRGQLTREQSMDRRPLRDVRGEPAVVVRAREFFALGEPVRRRIPIALDERDPRGNPQRLATLRAGRVHRGQDLLEPASAVAEISAGDPVVTQEGGQFRAVIEFARRGNRPLQRRHQVRVVATQRRQRGGLTRAAPPLDRANRVAPIVIPVPAPDSEIFTCELEQFGTVLAHGHQHPVPDQLAVTVDHQNRLGHQPVEDVEHVVGLQFAEPAHLFCGIEVEAAGKHRKPCPEQLFGLGAKFVAPVDKRAQGLLARHGHPASAGQQRKSPVQPFHDLRERQSAQPGGGELDGQRDAIEPVAQLHHGIGVLLCHSEIGIDGAGAIDQQAHRLVLVDPLRRQRVVHRRGRQRRNGAGVFAGDAERLPAGGQNPQSRGFGEHRVDQVGDRRQQVFAVVQHDQQLPLAQVIDELAGGSAVGLIGHRQRGHHDRCETRFVLDTCQFDHPAAVAERPARPLGQFVRDPGLSDAAGPGKRHQARLRHRLLRLGKLTTAADEAGDHRMRSDGGPGPDLAGRFCRRLSGQGHTVDSKTIGALGLTKLFAELGHGRRSIGGKVRHRALEEPAHVVRQTVAAQIRHGFGGDANELGNQSLAAAALEGGVPGDRAEERGAEPVDVGRDARRIAAQYLRGGERR